MKVWKDSTVYISKDITVFDATNGIVHWTIESGDLNLEVGDYNAELEIYSANLVEDTFTFTLHIIESV